MDARRRRNSIMTEDELINSGVPSQPEKRNRKTFFIGAIALLILAGVFAGAMSAAYNYLSAGIGDASTTSGSESTSSTGLQGLDKWNLAGRKLEYRELEERYSALYNQTYPFLLTEALKSEVIPSGVPAVYGQELNASFNADTDSMTAVLRRYEDHPLDEKQMERYKDIGLRISCEYCCGVKAIIFENGERACGCAHSYAMRGLAKYLILNHADEYTNDEILMELGKWKATFFPKQTISKAVARYAESGAVDPSVLIEMPNMV